MSFGDLFAIDAEEKTERRTAFHNADEEVQSSGPPLISSSSEQEMDFLDRLNEQQRRAAELPSRSVTVIAGSGTGKDRYAYSQNPLSP